MEGLLALNSAPDGTPQTAGARSGRKAGPSPPLEDPNSAISPRRDNQIPCHCRDDMSLDLPALAPRARTWAQARPKRMPMESIYYVLCFACHRQCAHCYEDRFRPYLRDGLADVVSMAKRNFPRIIANLPERMTYID